MMTSFAEPIDFDSFLLDNQSTQSVDSITHKPHVTLDDKTTMEPLMDSYTISNYSGDNSTDVDNLTDDATTDYYEYYDYADLEAAHDQRIYTRFYILGIILPMGLFFNSFAFIVFLRSPNIRRTTTGKFLIALSIADNMFLFGDYIRWLNTPSRTKQIIGFEFTEENLFACSTMYFLRYCGQLVSGWLTVAITVERFIVVTFPLKANRISTANTTNTAIVLIYFISAALTCFPYWTIRISEDFEYNFRWCEYRNQDEFNIWNWVVIRVASLLLPSVIIFIFTGLIIFKLKEIQQNRKEMSSTASKGKRQALERQLTLMLVSVAVTFLILRLPYTIAYYLFDFRKSIWGELIDDENPWFKHRLWFARDLCDAIATLNYAINFFLYCLTGSQFRSNMASCMKCKKVTAYRSHIYTSSRRDEKFKVKQTTSSSTISTSMNKITLEANGSNKN